MDDAASRFHILDHEREGLFLTKLSLAQGADGAHVPRVASQVVAANSLDRDDGSGVEQSYCLDDAGLVTLETFFTNHQTVPGTASRARHRLRVKTAIFGIVVLP